MRGWILDLYPGNAGEMVVWLKGEDGRGRRFVDRWAPSFYVSCDSMDDMRALSKVDWLAAAAAGMEVVSRYERITDMERREVLQVKVRDAKEMPRLAARVERSRPFGFYRIYNSDVPPAQTYL